jgi:predicted CXXCH cytochrome family protein
LCASCHESIEKRLATRVPHAPAGEDDGCTTCHGPHITRHPKLMLESISGTCFACHDGDSTAFNNTHLGYPPGSLDCASCHDPHASDQAGMLLDVMHEPFAGGDCSTCHTDVEGGAR